jgi:CheY-like chemotaxis protein
MGLKDRIVFTKYLKVVLSNSFVCSEEFQSLIYILYMQVELVGNGQLAVDKIQAGLYDMVLMDLQMPVMDGLTATKAIRKLGGKVGDIPIFALTADVLTQGRESLGAMGLTGYLTKPINWDELSDKINQVVLNKSIGSSPGGSP